jgi:hypothetical protein
MLIQVSVADSGRPLHFPAVFKQLSRQNVHHSRFAGTVRTDKSDVLACKQTEGYIFEQRAVTKIMG